MENQKTIEKKGELIIIHHKAKQSEITVEELNQRIDKLNAKKQKLEEVFSQEKKLIEDEIDFLSSVLE
jgi:septal ring factor EnvC (AmiA/AmiB activator)